MKKISAIYLALLASLLVAVSCASSDDDITTITSPYAYIFSFAIGNIESPFHYVTADGDDTIVYKIVDGEEFNFVIDQKAREIYNPDSLTYETKVDKVCGFVSCKGVPYRYDAEAGSYVYFSSSDSVDFTNPVSVKVISSDASYTNYYTIKLNVHAVDPDLLQWEAFEPGEVADITPARLLERDGVLYLFGTQGTDVPVVAISQASGEPSWEVSPIPVAGADISSPMLFGGKFYMIAGGDVYVSPDAAEWSQLSQGVAFNALLAVSRNGQELWAAGGGNILCSTDGVAFEVVQPLPAGFPLYGCSYACSPLATNKNIYRTTLIGFSTPEKDGDVVVWSKLSTESEWLSLGVEGEYKCPALNGLQVVDYDGALYAFGGAGVRGDKEIKPFSSFFVSKDRGIAWKQYDAYNMQLPKQLQGVEASFAATVAGDSRLWIVTPGGLWKGVINHLTFN